MRVLRSLSVFLAITLLAALPASGKQVTKFDAFRAFGDSLVDTGNDFLFTQANGFDPPIPPPAAYYAGHFSNGPVAFEYLWSLVKDPRLSDVKLTPYLAGTGPAKKGVAVNYAFGGSGSGVMDLTPGGFPVPGLRQQVELFAAAQAGMKPSNKTLYAIMTGANDYLREPPANPRDVVKNIAAAVKRLYELGARNVVVVNLPDLGAIPLVAGTPASGPLSALSADHNALLAQKLDKLAASLPNLDLVLVDVNALSAQLPPSINPVVPALDALVGPGTSLCLFAPATCPNVTSLFDAGNAYVFWDAQHPTTAFHFALAQYIYTLLSK